MKELESIVKTIEEQKFTLAHPRAITEQDLTHPIWQKIHGGTKPTIPLLEP